MEEKERVEEIEKVIGGIGKRGELSENEIETLSDIALEFCERMCGVNLYPYEKELGWRVIYSLLVEDAEELSALFSRQSGKCFAEGTPILMSDGEIKAVEEIEVGDFVCGDGGQSLKVGKLARGRERMFRVSPHRSEFRPHMVNQSHILTLFDQWSGKTVDVKLEKLLEMEDFSRYELLRSLGKGLFERSSFALLDYGTGEYFGFALEGKHKRFLLGDGTVTHNTETIAVTVCGCCVLLPELGKALPNDPRISKFARGLWCGIFGPTYEQAGIMWSRMKVRMYSTDAKEMLLDPEINIDLDSQSENLVLPNGSFVDCRTASPQAKIEGRTYHLMLLEECVGGETVVETEQGLRTIQDIVSNGYRGSVKGWDDGLGGIVWTPVLGHLVKVVSEWSYTLRFSDGAVIRCTPNHMWFVDGVGYVSTSQIYDSLQSLFNLPVRPSAVGDGFRSRSGLEARAIHLEPFGEAGLYRQWFSGEDREEENLPKKAMLFLRKDEKDIIHGVTLLSIQLSDSLNQAYDLKTETGNFFASGVLCHNCQDISAHRIRASLHPMMASCLTGDAMVPLSDGRFVRLDKMTMETETACYDEELKFHSKAPENFIDSGIQPCLTIRLNSMKELTGTLEHPVIVKPQEYPRLPRWTKLEDVRIGDQVAVPKSLPFFGKKSIGEDTARLLGMFVGDGSYCQERIPSKIWTAPKEEVAAFIGGLIDTTGEVTTQNEGQCTIVISQMNRGLLQQLTLLLLKFGIQSRIDEKIEAGAVRHRLTISGEASVLAFHANIRLLVERKQELEEGVRFLRDRRDRRETSFVPSQGDIRSAFPLDVDVVWERVVRIDDGGEQQVYDVVMPDPCHNFVANGIIAHNTAGTIVKIGTPNKVKSDFYEACRRNKRYDVAEGRTNSRKRSHFEFDYTVAQRYNPRYRKYILKEKRRLNEDSDEFRMKYKLHWMLERGMFIDPDLFGERGLKERNSNLVITKTVKGKERKVVFRRSMNVATYDATHENHAAIDVGRENSTVVTIGRPFWEGAVEFDKEKRFPLHVLNWLELQGDDHEAQHPQILNFLKNYKLSTVIIDATGKGDPIYSRIAAALEQLDIYVMPFIFSETSKDVGYKVLLQELQSGRLTYPAGPATTRMRKYIRFYQQMTDLEKTWRGQKMIVSKPKGDDARDDYCFSEDTEILTLRGWLSIDELSDRDKVFSVNVETGKVMARYPLRVIRRDFRSDEEMILIEGERIGQLVTGEHKVIYESAFQLKGAKSSNYCIGRAEDLVPGGEYRFYRPKVLFEDTEESRLSLEPCEVEVKRIDDYQGRVWCVTVDDGFVLVRWKGKISISGNCDSLMMLCYSVNISRDLEVEAEPNPFFGRAARWLRADLMRSMGANYRRGMEPNISRGNKWR